VFDEWVTAMSATDGAVRFERGAPRRFDLVVGVDGLHSVVRRLVFGPDADSARWLGAYLAVATVCPTTSAFAGAWSG